MSRAFKAVAGVALVAFAAGCAAPARTVGPATGGDAVRVRHGGLIQTVPLDTYAAIVALTELAPGAEAEPAARAVYEAQVVVARTYAVSRRGRHRTGGYDLCDTTHCQRFEAARLRTARWAALVTDLARQTSGQVLTHRGRPIEAVFHADCGGHTAAAEDVWSTSHPYLPARSDDVSPHRRWSVALARDDLERALNADARTRLRAPLRTLEVVTRDRSGRAVALRVTAGRAEGSVDAVEVDGTTFRAVVTSTLGIQALPSTRFALVPAGSGWRLSGSGFGHGVGLCQAGALIRARQGAAARDILGFYYPGAIIERAPAR